MMCPGFIPWTPPERVEGDAGNKQKTAKDEEQWKTKSFEEWWGKGVDYSSVREDPWRVERSPHPKTTSPWECGCIIESPTGCVTHSKLQCENTTTKGSKSVLNIMSNWICWLTEEVCTPHLNKWLTAIISKDHSMFNFKTQQGKLIIE